MNILVVNSGSSSVKYRLFDMRSGAELASGAVDRIGEPESRMGHRWLSPTGDSRARVDHQAVADHRAALEWMGDAFRQAGGMESFGGLHGLGHRVVHGGTKFREPALITDEVVQAIRELFPLAPLHNPPNLASIEVCREMFPDLPQVAVFDTAFHQTLPPHAFRYAIAEELYTRHQVRRYGFHGTSHRYVSRRAAEHLGRPVDTLNLITLHLGNGASATAIRNGRSVDTSMGLTPLEGLVMGTRCGDLDPAVPFHLGRVAGLSGDAVETMLNTQSGLKGLCGVNDMREILRRREAGDPAAGLAVDVFCHRLKKYIGAYAAVLGRVDAMVFTGGIGENEPAIRQLACRGLEFLGVELDAARNQQASGETAEIQADSGRIKVLVIATNEELEIARETMEWLQPGGNRYGVR